MKKKAYVGIVAIVLFLIFAIVCFSAPSMASYRMRDMFEVLGPVAGVFCIIAVFFQAYVFAMNTAASKTKISVCESVITGDGLTNSFTVTSFNLPYNQIQSVDVARNVAVVINTQQAKYTCYAQNCTEIRDAILRRMGR